MVNELPSSRPASLSPEKTAPSLSSLPYARLRWTIRLAGVVLMFGGAIFLGVMAAQLLLGSLGSGKVGDKLYMIVISILALGIGILVLRAGLDMLRSVDSSAVGSFSFVFALVYTFVLIQIVPVSALYYQHPVAAIVLFLLYLGVSYLVLKHILLALLFPK